MLTGLPDFEGPHGLERVIHTHTHAHMHTYTHTHRQDSKLKKVLKRADAVDARTDGTDEFAAGMLTSYLGSHAQTHTHSHTCARMQWRMCSGMHSSYGRACSDGIVDVWMWQRPLTHRSEASNTNSATSKHRWRYAI